METERETGTVVRWVLAKGFGFLKLEKPDAKLDADGDDPPDVFCHKNNFAEKSIAFDGVPLGTRVDFRRGVDRSGRDRAEDVRILDNSGNR